MKKFYTLLAGAMMAGSAMATLPVMQQPLDATATRVPQVQVMKSDFNTPYTISADQAPDGMMRAMNNGQYTMLIRLYGTMVDEVGLTDNGQPLTFDDYPMYLVIMANQGIVNSKYDFVQFFTVWPCKAWQDAYVSEDGVIDWDKAAAAFGSKEEAMAPMSISEWMANAGFKTSDGNAIIPDLVGFYGFPSFINSYYMVGQAINYWQATNPKNPTYLSTRSCSISGSSLSYIGNTYYEFKSFDPDLKDLTCTANLVMGVPNTQGTFTSPTVNTAVTLQGKPTVLGLESYEMEVSDMHVFNMGLLSSDTESDWNAYYYNTFDPVQFYVVTWCGPGLLYAGKNSSNQNQTAWTKTEPAMQPLGRWDSSADYTFATGCFFAPEGGAFNGMWTVPEPELELNANGGIAKWLSVPTAYKLVADGYNYMVSEEQGMMVCWDQYTASPAPGKGYVGVGDKNLGFNFSFSADGWGSNRIIGSTTKYIYHSDPTNFDTMTEVSAVGTGDFNAIARGDANSVEMIESNAPVVSTQYFNLQGQRLNVAPEHGIFIKAELKADGTVKATKVAK